MKLSELKETKYLKKEDVGDGLIVTIASLTRESIGIEGEATEEKWILHFKEDLKPMVLNWTNAQTIAAIIASEETDDWIGKEIVLFNDKTVSFGDKLVGGIRVRANEQAQPKRATPRKASDTMPKEAPQTKEYDERNPPPYDPDDGQIPF